MGAFSSTLRRLKHLNQMPLDPSAPAYAPLALALPSPHIDRSLPIHAFLLKSNFKTGGVAIGFFKVHDIQHLRGSNTGNDDFKALYILSPEQMKMMPKRMLRHKALIQCALLAFGVSASSIIDTASDTEEAEKNTNHLRGEQGLAFLRKPLSAPAELEP